MSDEKIKIRCPQCLTDGKARAEHLNRRVSCKHCGHIFRVTPVVEDSEGAGASSNKLKSSRPGSAAARRHEARQQIDKLKAELERIQNELSAQSAEQPAYGHLEKLTAQLEEAREQVQEAEARLQETQARLREAEAARTRSEQALHAEAEALRVELAQAREEARKAGEKLGQRERALLDEIKSLHEQLDETVLTSPEADRTQELEDELRMVREDLAQARDAAEAEARHHRAAVEVLEARHALALGEVRDQLERASAEARAAEERRLASEAERAGSDSGQAGELEALRAERDDARGALDGLRAEWDRANAEMATSLEEAREQLARAQAELGESATTREDRDRLASELDALRGRLDEALTDREQLRVAHESEVRGLRDELASVRAGAEGDRASRDQLAQAQARLEEAEAARRELDEVRGQCDRAVKECEELRGQLQDAQRALADSRESASTEMELRPYPAVMAEIEDQSKLTAEIEALRADLAQARRDRDLEVNRLAELEKAREAARSETARRLDDERARAKAEAEGLRRSLAQAQEAAAASTRARDELAARVRELEEAPAPATVPPADMAAPDEARRQAVDEAVKGAWADFERRLAETQAKLKAANARADLLENEAREAFEQGGSSRKGPGSGGNSSYESGASSTGVRILKDRGAVKLTLADAESRLALARQLAVERRDRTLIDRITKLTEKVRGDLEAHNDTLAETLVRGAEIEVGLDPGGYSIGGLKIFRPSPTIVSSLAALEPAYDRALKMSDLPSIRSTIGEFRAILGDQAGLPEIRRPGRIPAVKRTVTPPEAVRLFLGALEADQSLIRPMLQKRPLPETSLTTYSSLMEGCAAIRPAVERHAPDKLGLIDQVLQATGGMLVRKQQSDGHFPFLDPRGKPSKLATIVETMVARSPVAVKDGWVIAPDPVGFALAETGQCGVALLAAGAALDRAEWTQAGLKAADWAAVQPCMTDFAANARAISLLARAYLQGKQDRHRDGLVAKLNLGLLPGQVENGRWVDPAAAQTTNHLTILQALLDAWEALPADHPLRAELKASLDRAAGTLLDECKVLGVPAQGGALRTLARHRDLTRPNLDPRLEPAIVDAITVVQELCHDGGKPKLGVTPDQLAILACV